MKLFLLSDINRDGKVNILELALATAAFNTKQGAPNWNPAADLNKDGIIDIFDLVLAGVNFGKIESPWPERD